MTNRPPIELSPYQADGPARFASERAVLAALFPRADFRIEHIDSTSVPGLGAKRTVDILLGAPTLRDIEVRIPAMATLGYPYMPGHERLLPQRRFFAQPPTCPRSFHVHAVQVGQTFWRDHLHFRDALRADPALAAEYHALKPELTARFANNVGATFECIARNRLTFKGQPRDAAVYSLLPGDLAG